MRVVSAIMLLRGSASKTSDCVTVCDTSGAMVSLEAGKVLMYPHLKRYKRKYLLVVGYFVDSLRRIFPKIFLLEGSGSMGSG